jgi:hypothetical protein
MKTITNEERKELEKCFSNCPCCDDETVQRTLDRIRLEKLKEFSEQK